MIDMTLKNQNKTKMKDYGIQDISNANKDKSMTAVAKILFYINNQSIISFKGRV